MAKTDIYKELIAVVRSLSKLLAIMVQLYGPYLKAIVIVGIGWVAWKLGRKSISDPIENKVSATRKMVENRAWYMIQLPEQIRKWQKIKWVLLAVSIGLGVVVMLLQYASTGRSKRSKQLIRGLIYFSILPSVGVMAAWVYEKVLTRMSEQAAKDRIGVSQQITALTQMFGQKASGLLQSVLCKEKIAVHNKKVPKKGVCSRVKCQEERSLLRDKTTSIQALVQNGLTFEWCTICRARVPFDEFLPFRSRQFEWSGESGCELQVIGRNAYLLEELERMVGWVRQVGPCNCSVLYWGQSSRAIEMYKARKKEEEKREEVFMQRSRLIKHY